MSRYLMAVLSMLPTSCLLFAQQSTNGIVDAHRNVVIVTYDIVAIAGYESAAITKYTPAGAQTWQASFYPDLDYCPGGKRVRHNLR
jgi:hypothetical protein